MLNSSTKQNRELRQQKNLLAAISSQFFGSKKQLEVILNENFANAQTQERKQMRERQLRPNEKRPSQVRSDETFELVDAIDYSVSCSMMSVCTSQATSKNDSQYTINRTSDKKFLFRKAAISIMAVHRIICFSMLNRNCSVFVPDGKKNTLQFSISTVSPTRQSSVFKGCSKTFHNKVGSNSAALNEEVTREKRVFDWFNQAKDNGALNQINLIAEELNKYLYAENENENKFMLAFKKTIVKSFSLFNTKSPTGLSK